MEIDQLVQILLTNGNFAIDDDRHRIEKTLRMLVANTVNYDRMLLLPESQIDDIAGFMESTGDPDNQYCFYKDFNPMAIARAMKQSMFFMSTEFFSIYVPLIRHHDYKCMIPLNPNNHFKYHRSIRTAARKLKGAYLTVDGAFNLVVREINKSYDDCWIVKRLCDGYAAIHYANDFDIYPVNVHSVELWNAENKLIAGEIGFVTGESYVSLSGFHTANNSGNIQMASLGMLLLKSGFKVWDLGMQLDYKYNYGAIDCDRKAQSEIYKQLSDKPLHLESCQKFEIDDLLEL